MLGQLAEGVAGKELLVGCDLEGPELATLSLAAR
jgi:hypothetical protein